MHGADENNAAMRSNSQQLSLKVTEMNDKFKVAVAEMEANIRERVTKEFQGDIARDLMVMTKKCTGDI
jgi:hypothetical protein